MSAINHQFRLAARPAGLPKRSDWNYTEEPVRDPRPKPAKRNKGTKQIAGNLFLMVSLFAPPGRRPTTSCPRFGAPWWMFGFREPKGSLAPLGTSEKRLWHNHRA